ncbi:hypothetical protein [Fusibacter sp. 3D3]|uniref:hypothetical protein n=1 Tax=Fusibacter sp. 3D3 TaxID=1048380 RepID=UPI00085320EB|nr:hypothetical protein [Fusibacter sp. 3D3]GAU78920.1 hypothetical protein F3D3_3556 [Fusibacter sp. 3D3]
MKKITFILLLVFMLNMGSVFATTEDSDFTDKPKEETIGGIMYLDGIPVIHNDRELELLNTTLKNSSFMRLFSNPYPVNQWSNNNNSFIYRGYDRDIFTNKSKDISLDATLATSSFTNYEISGSVEFGFKGVAEASMGASVGQEWGKVYTMSVTVPPQRSVELVSACKVMNKQWIYPYQNGGNITNYYAGSYNKYGTEYWLYDN